MDTGLIAPGPNFGMESCVVRVNSTTLAFAISEGLKGGGGSLNRGRMTVRLSNTDGEDWLPGVVVDAGMLAAPASGLDLMQAPDLTRGSRQAPRPTATSPRLTAAG